MDFTAVYRRLAQLLTDAVSVSSLEIIPGSQEQWSGSEDNPQYPFLLIDGNLGIPQSILYKSYLLAVRRLPKQARIPDLGREAEHSDLVSSTAIILLANPGHQTALNRRKRLIQLNSPLITPYHELKFIASLLGIKQASKCSSLWHHRRWLLRRTHDPIPSATPHEVSDSLKDVPIPCDALAVEFHLAAQASEIYPRNYHAWLHRYICMQCLICRVSEGAAGGLNILHSELKFSQRWIELHVSDHTAVHYWSCVVAALGISDVRVPLPSPSPSTDAALVSATSVVGADDRIMLSHALSLLSSYPTHESLWMYLRFACAVSHNRPGPSIEWITDFALSFCDGEHTDGGPAGLVPGESIVQRTLASVRAEDIFKVKRHALALFAWTLLLSGKLHLDNAWVQRLLLDSEMPALSILRELRAP